MLVVVEMGTGMQPGRGPVPAQLAVPQDVLCRPPPASPLCHFDSQPASKSTMPSLALYGERSVRRLSAILSELTGRPSSLFSFSKRLQLFCPADPYHK